MVSTHSRPKAAGRPVAKPTARSPVSTHSRPKAAGRNKTDTTRKKSFQHTAARRRLVAVCGKNCQSLPVSTHSRPKAAGSWLKRFFKRKNCFNTQPPEGGWEWIKEARKHIGLFQHTAARRRLGIEAVSVAWDGLFQHTAARRRLAANEKSVEFACKVSTHSRPKAAGALSDGLHGLLLFQHTAARRRLVLEDGGILIFKWFQHTAARRRLETAIDRDALQCLFQHTAARRRLGVTGGYCFRTVKVSTHSRPKAAGQRLVFHPLYRVVSTHSRPKAAGLSSAFGSRSITVSTHSRPKAAGKLP